uniref:PABS domain-containing protein n=1 Tax=Leersia perrieri TaxID=77586 RepID=A0A0D9X9V3_9ORYZ
MAAISPELEGLQYLEPSRFIAFSFPNPSSTMPPTPTPRMRLFRDKPRCLCVGVGGGALLMLIRKGLQCDVLGIEADGVVLDVARSHFGLVEDEFLRVRVGDAIQMIQDFAQQGEPGMNFSAIMVDLDSSDANVWSQCTTIGDDAGKHSSCCTQNPT